MKNPLNLSKYKVVLASNSPRRKELLASIVDDFEVQTIPDIDESYPDDLPSTEVAAFLSDKKASAYLDMLEEDTLIITSDTIVCDDDKVFGKPVDALDAVKILNHLSGNTHHVITGVTLLSQHKKHTFSSTTEVTFARLSNEEINFYIQTYKPFDKAGAYGIQEWIGHIGVESIKGSYFNVMGLPVQQLYQELKRF